MYQRYHQNNDGYFKILGILSSKILNHFDIFDPFLLNNTSYLIFQKPYSGYFG